MRADDDLALEALLWPFDAGLLQWAPARTAFLHAREGVALHARDTAGLACAQPWKPAFDALQRAGLDVAPALDTTRRFDSVLLLPPRQREQARALLVQALDLAAPGGRVVVAARNDEGGRSLADDLARVAGVVASEGRSKSRVAWTAPLHGIADPALADAWRAGDAPREVAGAGLLSRPGVFAADRIDIATQLLIDHLPCDLRGRAADLGAGWGVLSHALLARAPGITALDAYEADARAVELARGNLAGARVPVAVHWHDVTRGLDARFDTIVCNPPFHAQGRDTRVDIGRRFLEVAADALAPGGRLWLVANRQLPYEATLAPRFARIATHAQAHGFKVIEAVHA